MPARKVSDDDVRRIRALWLRGHTAPEIARLIGHIKPSTVYNYVGKRVKLERLS